MNNKKNFISAIVYQIFHIIYGLVVPRIILLYFGSEINGLISSITQFLSFISLLEGGLGAVALSELYIPIEERNEKRIQEILHVIQIFFNKLSVFYCIYTIILAFIYAYTKSSTYNTAFIISLTVILSLTNLAEYLFSITYRLYLQADQKIYITNVLSSIVLIVNVLFALISVKIFPDIRFLKLLSASAFFVQPIVLRLFIPKDYRHGQIRNNSNYKLKNRWSGFSQNLAHFINMNTDIIVLTIFCSYFDVSIYSVYMLAINALRLLISAASNSYQAALGKYIAQGEKDRLKRHFNKFFAANFAISVCMLSCCLLLVNSFVGIYTKGITDANYYQPAFALIMSLANLIYCIREPYRLLILAAGKFKETNTGAYVEAIINVIASVVLVNRFGLIGVAFGTLLAISYRIIYFVFYLRKDIINLQARDYMPYIIGLFVIICVNVLFYLNCTLPITSILSFILYGIVLLCAEGAFAVVVTVCILKYQKDSIRN